MSDNKKTPLQEPPPHKDSATNWRPHPCPICKSMSVKAYRPFCSLRCANIDLGRWLKGNYTFPGTVANGETEEK